MLLGQTPYDSVAVERVQTWTRRRFKLNAEAAILVSEVACRLPGCPPLETVVAFWSAEERRHQFKLYKPLLEVTYDDIGWLMGSPDSHDGAGWDCC
jgi:nitrate reductase delta subunit